jgi:hypothetical protein
MVRIFLVEVRFTVPALMRALGPSEADEELALRNYEGHPGGRWITPLGWFDVDYIALARANYLRFPEHALLSTESRVVMPSGWFDWLPVGFELQTAIGVLDV